MTSQKETRVFRALVLYGLWLLLRKRGGTYITHWREQAISYVDETGQSGEQAKEYRRSVIFEE